MASECLVRDVTLRSGQLGPVLVNFEHAKLKTDDAAQLKCGVFTSNDKSKICTVAAVAAGGDVVYQGSVQQDEGDLCRTFLAVRNKRNNKMRIFEASSVILSPTVASDFIDRFDSQDKKEAYHHLSHAFGSKKAKRVADQRARMEVNVDAVKDKLSTTVNDVVVNLDNLKPPEDDTLDKILPPCNREASTPADVYPISGILKEKEIRSLEKSVITTETQDEDSYKFSPFYKRMVEYTSQSTKLKALLLYAESLINFCNTDKRKQKTVKGLKLSDKIDKRILKDFSTVNGESVTGSRSKFMLDKAVMYIIILGLHIGSFSIDLNIIASSIKFLDMNRIKMLARIIGTQPSKNIGAPKDLVVLRVPLPPKQSLILKSRKSRR